MINPLEWLAQKIVGKKSVAAWRLAGLNNDIAWMKQHEYRPFHRAFACHCCCSCDRYPCIKEIL